MLPNQSPTANRHSKLVFGTCILWFCQPIRVLVSCPFCERLTKSLDDDIKRVDALFHVQFEPNKDDALARQTGHGAESPQAASRPICASTHQRQTRHDRQRESTDEWPMGSTIRFSKEVAVANESTFTAMVFANRMSARQIKQRRFAHARKVWQ